MVPIGCRDRSFFFTPERERLARMSGLRSREVRSKLPGTRTTVNRRIFLRTQFGCSSCRSMPFDVTQHIELNPRKFLHCRKTPKSGLGRRLLLPAPKDCSPVQLPWAFFWLVPLVSLAFLIAASLSRCSWRRLTMLMVTCLSSSASMSQSLSSQPVEVYSKTNISYRDLGFHSILLPNRHTNCTVE